MWIVRLALTRRYTFIVLALLLPLLGALALFGTPLRAGMPDRHLSGHQDPGHRGRLQLLGLPPEDVSGRITSNFERALTTIVNDVEHVESQAYPGVTVIKVFFQPGVDINLAMSQVTAFSQTTLRFMPPGITPPLVLKYNASTVPILQLALSSTKLAESELFDFANSFMRAQLATVAGAAVPFPYGGASRQIQVDLDPGEAARAGTLGRRRQHGHRQPEPDHPGWHAENRRHRVQRQAQLESARLRRAQRPAAARRQRHRDVRARRRVRARRVIRRRPTSCAWTASARCS
jgi:multidrug efflux pump subunit AcrB